MTPATYTLTVPDIGTFEIRRRTFKVQMAVHAELNRLTEGAPLASLSDWFLDICGLVAELKTLVVKAPDGWSIDDLDPLDDGYDRLRAVHQAIRAREGTFRPSAPGPQAESPPTSE